jgi:hypothetical protein
VDIRIASYRTEHGGEVDLVVELGGTVWALELKASRSVGPGDLRGLRSFADFYGKRHTPLVPYLEDVRRRVGDVDVRSWQDGLRQIGL